MSGLREQKKAEKLQAIREAAWALFAEKGFEDTTVREICERAHIAAGTLFLYVADKHDLLILLFGERVEEAQRRALARLPKGGLLDQVLHIFGALFDFYAEDPRLSRSVVRNLLFTEGAAASRLRGLEAELFTRIAGLVVEAQARGELRQSVEPYPVTVHLFSLYFMALLSMLNGLADRASLDGQLRAQADLLMQGISAQSWERK